MLGSDGESECGEGFREPMPRVGIKAEFVVAAVEVLHESVSCADTCAERSRLRPRIGLSRDFMRP